jgi:3-mercaptopropionate dioxygenase
MADAFILDTPVVRAFIGKVQHALQQAAPAEALELIRGDFVALLADPTWLPASYRAAAEQSGMGGGIATWLIYRATDGGLSLFALVVPPGSATPVHDHLAWGFVGLYQGTQDEEVFRLEPGSHDDHAPLTLTARSALTPGSLYKLLPPHGDIHRVITTSEIASVSIHLLGNDTGCVWRHAYTPEEQRVTAFRSGWSNVACHEETIQTQETH